MSWIRTGFILSILCVIGLFLLVPIYVEVQERQQGMDPILFGGDLVPLGETPLEILEEEHDIHPDILLGAIIVVGIGVIVLPLIGFWYDEQTKDDSKVVIKIQKQDLTTASGLTNPTKIIISFIIAIVPVIAFLIVWYMIILSTPDAKFSESQELEYLTLQIAVSGMLFISTFWGVYSFLSRT